MAGAWVNITSALTDSRGEHFFDNWPKGTLLAGRRPIKCLPTPGGGGGLAVVVFPGGGLCKGLTMPTNIFVV